MAKQNVHAIAPSVEENSDLVLTVDQRDAISVATRRIRVLSAVIAEVVHMEAGSTLMGEEPIACAGDLAELIYDHVQAISAAFEAADDRARDVTQGRSR